MGYIPELSVVVLIVLLLVDYWFLFSPKNPITAQRFLTERLSNGDENNIQISIVSTYRNTVSVEIIDEIPHQFQNRNVCFYTRLEPQQQQSIHYQLRPLKRGLYNFGHILVYVNGIFSLLKKRHIIQATIDVPVYPSYLQLRQYQLMAISNRLSEAGIKKVRRFGHSMEFEQIKEYVQGDDYRTLNWQATARRGQLMVNTYSDEKSQQVYCIIDKGRIMKMPFDGLSLLDYSINASLVLSNIALMKQDKAGLVTFSDTMGTHVKADKKALQMQLIIDALYNQKTKYLETDFEKLYSHLKTKVTQRSLIVLFTNFESLSGMRRQLPYLKKIASQHLLITVFFKNTTLQQLLDANVQKVEDVFNKAIAEQFDYEKRQIVKELNIVGINTILTAPKDLTVNAINKYLEIKARNLL